MELVSINKCFGCTACATICPQKAITMVEDAHGFKYPQIDNERCVKCGLCKKACPVEKTEHIVSENIEVYAVKNRSEEILLNSSSGGLYTAIAEYVIDNNGIVYGVTLNDDFRAVYTRVTTKKDLSGHRRSKYVQSDVGDTYRRVIEDLKQGILVLFSGTPCQCAGLSMSIPKNVNRDRLILVDLICNGVPSARLFQEYIHYCEEKAGKKIITHVFRSKDPGYKHRLHVEKNIFLDGTYDLTSEYSQAWKTLFYTGNAHRECCFSCPYAYYDKRPSDISIGDYWGAEEAGLSLTTEHGLSVYFGNTEKGTRLIQELEPYLFIEKSDLENAIRKQPRLRGVLAKADRRNVFWNEYDNKGAKYVIEKYGRCTRFIIMKHKIKKVLITIGMIQQHTEK